jgi:hypothetical protein
VLFRSIGSCLGEENHRAVFQGNICIRGSDTARNTRKGELRSACCDGRVCCWEREFHIGARCARIPKRRYNGGLVFELSHDA